MGANNVSMAASKGSMIMLDRRGQPWTFGDNRKQQTGLVDGKRTWFQYPIWLEAMSSVIAVGAGYEHMVIVFDLQSNDGWKRGLVRAFGSNDEGQLGLGSYCTPLGHRFHW